jgi:hypothetical protein
MTVNDGGMMRTSAFCNGLWNTQQVPGLGQCLIRRQPMAVALSVRVSTSRQPQQQTIAPPLSRLRAYVATQPAWHGADEPSSRDDGYRGSSATVLASTGSATTLPWRPLSGSCSRPPIASRAMTSIRGSGSMHARRAAVRSPGLSGPCGRSRLLNGCGKCALPGPHTHAHCLLSAGDGGAKPSGAVASCCPGPAPRLAIGSLSSGPVTPVGDGWRQSKPR